SSMSSNSTADRPMPGRPHASRPSSIMSAPWPDAMRGPSSAPATPCPPVRVWRPRPRASRLWPRPRPRPSISTSAPATSAVWHAGDDASSFAEPVDAPDMRMIIVTVDRARKAVSSREAMRATAATSPFYSGWVSSTEDYLSQMLAACRAGDFTRIGEITESHALRMHGLIQSSVPPIRFLNPTSHAIFDAVAEVREQGIEAYSTADAGPNVAVIVRPSDAEALAGRLTAYGDVRVVGPGPGAHLLTEEGAA